LPCTWGRESERNEKDIEEKKGEEEREGEASKTGAFKTNRAKLKRIRDATQRMGEKDISKVGRAEK